LSRERFDHRRAPRRPRLRLSTPLDASMPGVASRPSSVTHPVADHLRDVPAAAFPRAALRVGSSAICSANALRGHSFSRHIGAP
jgi:hypothetical protein